ncbi:hypothetical protein GJ496_005250 [Pomphorhynchus laevis]|nr:hypothetical protein GJ496_005250 [Pomphorhynchus laevis]
MKFAYTLLNNCAKLLSTRPRMISIVVVACVPPTTISLGTRHRIRHDPLLSKFLEFASVKYKNEIYLTPRDFLACILNTEFGCKNLSGNLPKREIKSLLEIYDKSKQIVNKIGFTVKDHHGLISFSEYVLLGKLIFGPPNAINITFKIFDQNGDGTLTADEFHEVIESASTVQQSPKQLESGLKDHQHKERITVFDHFFRNGGDIITVDTLEKFAVKLRSEVMLHGFQILSKQDNENRLKAKSFTERLSRPRFQDTDMSIHDLSGYFDIVSSLPRLKSALAIYTQGIHPISRADFYKAVQISTNRNISPAICDILFDLFDFDDNGLLQSDELIYGMFTFLSHSMFRTSSFKKAGFNDCMRNRILHSKLSLVGHCVS